MFRGTSTFIDVCRRTLTYILRDDLIKFETMNCWNGIDAISVAPSCSQPTNLCIRIFAYECTRMAGRPTIHLRGDTGYYKCFVQQKTLMMTIMTFTTMTTAIVLVPGTPRLPPVDAYIASARRFIKSPTIIMLIARTTSMAAALLWKTIVIVKTSGRLAR